MKIKITFKDPDMLDECIGEGVRDYPVQGLSDDEYSAVKEKRKEEVRELCSQWFEYGEYLTVEVDTETKSIRVVPVEEMDDE